MRNFRLSWNTYEAKTKEGDLIQLVGLSHKNFIVRLKAGSVFQSHRGIIKHEDLIGLPWGTQIFSHKGSPFFLLQPSFTDLLIDTPRSTQILYPKDIGFILVSLGVSPGSKIIEAGTGSGALTSAFANAVGDNGQIWSYEIKSDIQNRARKNLTRLGLLDRVNLKQRDIAEGFDETDVDILFLDVPDPYNYLAQVRQALKPGGYFGCILPTTNQISLLLTELRQRDFIYIEVCEILLRYYKPEPDRFRPADRMIAHTGYLIFARPVIKAEKAREVPTEISDEENGMIKELDDGCEGDLNGS
jgi:tRNA (adenine57-N1/adenine58-N1)-methyltransferase